MECREYQEIYEQSTALMVAVDPDLKVLAASKGFLDVVRNDRESAIGRFIFDVFPKNQPHIDAVLITTMRMEFNKVLKYKTSRTSPVVRFDIPVPDTDDEYEVMYWKVVNTPILDHEQNVKFINQRYVDVTHSKELSQQLEVEKKNLDEYKSAVEYIRNALMQAPAPLCVLRGPEHIFELANKEFFHIVGDREIIGKPAREAMPEIEEQGVFETLDEVYDREKSYVGREIPLTFTPDNHEPVKKYVDFVYQILYDTKGEKEGIFVLGMDVTEQVVARQKVEESEYNYRKLIEESTVATAIFTGPDINVQYANDKMLEIWRKDKLVFGKPLHEILPELKDQRFPEILKQVYTTGETYTGVEEEVKLSVDGKMEIFYFNFAFTALRNSGGEIYGIQNIAIDVTDEVQAKRALREREETLKQLLNSIPQKISHTDEKGNVVFFNQQWMDETGYSRKELQDNGWEKTMHPEDIETVKVAWQNALQSNSVFEIESRIFHKESGYRWHLNRAVPVKDKNGELIMWVGSNTDIHEQKKQKKILEQAVHERTKELKQANQDLIIQNQEKEKQKKELIIANKELESFAYISSHDLQEPLRKIQIFGGRILELEDQNLSEKGRDYFQRMQEAAGRMQTLIKDLLSFSRVNNNEGDFEKVDLKKIVEDVKEDLKELIEEKKATIEVAESCEAEVIEFQFRQLMKNLISNSLKFSKPDTPPHVTIENWIKKGAEIDNKDLDPEIKYCHIITKDNGIGFNQRFNERIFEVFQRLHSQDVFEGTGIGLAIVKKIIDTHHGIITAQGEPNKGARFDMYIPTS